MANVTAKAVSAKSVNSKKNQQNKREIYAEVAYYYPQYTLEEVSKLPARDITLLLRIAHRQEAMKMFNLTQIVASPHTKKGQGVKKLSDYFKKESNK